MKRNIIETVIGAVVLFVAGFFLVFSYKTANVGTVSGYMISANFTGIGGLKVGDDVQISGVKIGSVADVELNSETYLAKVTMSIDPSVKLPTDTAALISSESLLGGRYLALEPGAEEDVIENGGRIQYTQAPQNLEQLLGQFIFSVSNDKKDDSSESE
jgi:phospholipid/cholesterol/gamma-HCH transport system substrate-binding protein